MRTYTSTKRDHMKLEQYQKCYFSLHKLRINRISATYRPNLEVK